MLSDDCMLSIMYFLDPQDLGNIRMVNNRLCILAQNCSLIKSHPSIVINNVWYLKDQAYFTKELLDEIIKGDTKDTDYLINRLTPMFKNFGLTSTEWTLLMYSVSVSIRATVWDAGSSTISWDDAWAHSITIAWNNVCNNASNVWNEAWSAVKEPGWDNSYYLTCISRDTWGSWNDTDRDNISNMALYMASLDSPDHEHMCKKSYQLATIYALLNITMQTCIKMRHCAKHLPIFSIPIETINKLPGNHLFNQYHELFI